MSDRKSSDSTQERNQCDGCQRGLPVRHSRITMDETPLHYDQDTGIVVMACTSDRYKAKTLPSAIAAPSRDEIKEELDRLTALAAEQPRYALECAVEYGKVLASRLSSPDRSDAVNLSRNWLAGDPLLTHQINRIAEAVLQMDAWILEVTKK